MNPQKHEVVMEDSHHGNYSHNNSLEEVLLHSLFMLTSAHNHEICDNSRKWLHLHHFGIKFANFLFRLLRMDDADREREREWECEYWGTSRLRSRSRSASFLSFLFLYS
jgi:hypothetical protein